MNKRTIASSLANNNKKRAPRPLDFDSYQKVWIALQLYYDGYHYHGMATQRSLSTKSNDENDLANNFKATTIEDSLFVALLKSRLIQSPSTCHFSRCGRTDTGVSALGQVVGLCVRGHKLGCPPDTPVLPYDTILNGLLPFDIRVVRFGLVTNFSGYFNARFDCLWREYQYFFDAKSSPCQPYKPLDLEVMRKAMEDLLGTHDFIRLACRDESVKSTMRTVLSVSIEAVPISFSHVSMCRFTIRGTAFLYHQVRCIMGALFTIGQGLKPSNFIKELLDDKSSFQNDNRGYELAPPGELFLSRCTFPEGLIQWQNPMKEDKQARHSLMFHTTRTLALGYLLSPNDS